MEQDTVKVVKRTIGLVLILAAAMGIAGILLEIFGSPWGASGAQKAAQAYVEQTYPEQEFQVDKAAYSLSVHGYEARVEHAQKEDVFFTVTVKDGQIVSDSYQADVREKGNTVRRLEEDYAQMVQQRLEEADLQYSLMLEGSTADMPTLDQASQLLGEVYRQMEAAGYEFSFYGVQLEKDGAAVAVAQVAPSQIKGGNLARILQLAVEENADSSIYVSVRFH